MTEDKAQSITSEYAEILKEIRDILADIYSVYDQNGTLNWGQLTQFNGLREVQDQIAASIVKFDDGLSSGLRTFLTSTYETSHDHSVEAISRYVDAQLAFGSAKPEVLEKALQNEFTGLTLNERLEKRRNDLILKMKEDVTRGLHQGETYGTMANRVKDVLEGDAVKARRIVRTEAHRVREQATIDVAKEHTEHGIVMTKTWNTVGDERVRRQHRSMDGKTIPVDEDFVMPDGVKGQGPGMMGAPQHDVNDRCFLTYEVVELKE